MNITLGFTRPEVLTIFKRRGLKPPSARQLYYWSQTKLIEVHMHNAKTPVYSYQAVLDAMVICRLLEGGVSLQRIRKALSFLEEKQGWRTDTPSLQAYDLLTDGQDIYMAENIEVVISLLKRPGQLVWKAFTFNPADIIQNTAAIIRMEDWKTRLTPTEQRRYLTA